MNIGSEMTVEDKTALLRRQVENISAGWKSINADVDVLYCLFEQIDLMREALKPFADAALKSGLIDPMTDKPLPTSSKACLAIRVEDWRRAIELTMREKQGERPRE